MNSPIFLNDNIVSNTFVGISTQENEFDDGTSSWNNNLTLKALGKKINIILNKKNIVDELHIEA